MSIKLPPCPLDVTYCVNADCKNRRCDRHLSVLKKVQRRFPGAMVSVADFSGTCREYIRQLVDEEEICKD